MLRYHREQNPDGPYQRSLCASPAETGSRWDCSPGKVTQLRREAARMRRRVADAIAARSDPRAASEAAAREFGVPVGDFLRVIGCESGFNPSAVNPSSGALGLGQHLPRYWGGRAAALGYSYGDWDDPRANARVSAWLWATSGPQHWVCY